MQTLYFLRVTLKRTLLQLFICLRFISPPRFLFRGVVKHFVGSESGQIQSVKLLHYITIGRRVLNWRQCSWTHQFNRRKWLLWPLHSSKVRAILYPLRPKASGLAQHGWLEESDPARCDFVCDGRSICSLPWRTSPLALGLIYYKMYTKHRHELRHTRKAWPGTLVDPCLLSGCS
jgi:hypothetical protein